MKYIKYWWFRKRLQFLSICIKKINNLYNNLPRNKRDYYFETLDDMTCESTQELWKLLYVVRDLDM